MQSDIDAASVAWFHDRQLRQRDWPVLSRAVTATTPAPAQGARAAAWEGIDANHRYNGLLWQEQQRTRRLDLPPAEIAAGKRLIDRYDQKRHEAVDRIDDALLALLAGVVRQSDARLSSETAGAMVDRLSVLALRIHLMRLHAQRQDGGDEHARACSAGLDGLQLQRRDLMACFDALLAETRRGHAYFKVYRQRSSASLFDHVRLGQAGEHSMP